MAGVKGRSGKYPKSPEHRAKLAEASRRWWEERKAAGLPPPNLGVPMPVETRERMSASKLGNQNARVHGMSGTRTHNSWRDMKARCDNPKSPNWKYYGGRGISYVHEWVSFEGFYADMGDRPEGTTLDRIDVNGNYGPNNCRWATPGEQSSNRRVSVRGGGDAS